MCLNLNKLSDAELWAAVMCGFHLASRISEIEQLEDRDISCCKIDGRPCVSLAIRRSKTDKCQQGVHRTLVATYCALCPVNGIAQWLDPKTWNPKSPNKVGGASIARRINEFLKDISLSKGMGVGRIISHPLRAGCATTLYANGVVHVDIQRWGRCRSPIYMRYV